MCVYTRVTFSRLLAYEGVMSMQVIIKVMFKQKGSIQFSKSNRVIRFALYLINFRIYFIIRSYVNQLIRWLRGMFPTCDTGEAGFETRSEWTCASLFISCLEKCVQVYSFLVWKSKFVQGKITQIFVPILKRDFVSSQSAFIQGINSSPIPKINPIQN